MAKITVRKLDHNGGEITTYPGEVVKRSEREIVLRTIWDQEPLDLGFIVLEPGDRWLEYFFTDRWYNIFRVQTKDDRLKGWYCNVARPAQISADAVSAQDLALDLWISPDGTTQVLDEDEFAALPLSPEDRAAARQALNELQTLVARQLSTQAKPPSND